MHKQAALKGPAGGQLGLLATYLHKDRPGDKPKEFTGTIEDYAKSRGWELIGHLPSEEELAKRRPMSEWADPNVPEYKEDEFLDEGLKTAAYILGLSLGEKVARGMPSFTKQDRPKKVKDIYKALKRDHPDMPAAMKARIAARQGKKGKQKQGPPYKGPLTSKD